MTSLPLSSHGRARWVRHSLALSPLTSGQPVPQALPNNFGPTLLIALGILLIPFLIGVPFVLCGLARIRDAQGELALPWLSNRRPGLLGWWRASS
jgi:hypothetical protein